MTYRSQLPVRSIRKRILILCEGGKTEPNYFKAIKADKSKSNNRSALRIEVHHTKKNTAKELIDEAIKLKKEATREKNPYDDIWVVFDRDGYTKHPEAFNKAETNKINIAFSSTCFEFWLLLHFEYTTAPFNDCNAIIRKLKIHIPDYEKGKGYYHLLKDNIDVAIDRGAQIILHCNKTGNTKIWEYNPYTDVGKLVEKLINI